MFPQKIVLHNTENKVTSSEMRITISGLSIIYVSIYIQTDTLICVSYFNVQFINNNSCAVRCKYFIIMALRLIQLKMYNFVYF